MRAIGPNPGKNPNKVGDRPALNCSRFPCCTQSPPVNWFRTMNGPADVWFTIDPRLQLPRPGEQRREVDAGLPVDLRTEGPVVQQAAPPAGHRGVGDDVLLARVVRLIVRGEAVRPVPRRTIR